MMKNFYSLLMVFCMVLGFSTGSKATDFVEGMEDLPIMTGLTQIESDNISFGNEETRFVEAYFEGTNTSFKNIIAFYKETLPQLGWNFVSKNGNILHFERDMEILDIAQETAKPLLVRITLKSKN